jgi:hypothetical protein
MRFPGMKQSFPVYLQNVPHINMPGMGHSGNPDHPEGYIHDGPHDPPFVEGQHVEHTTSNPTTTHHDPAARPRGGSILKDPNHPHTRPRGESLAAMSRRVDFSLGMKHVSAADMTGDVFEDDERSRERQRAIVNITTPSRERSSADRSRGSNDIGRSTSISSGLSGPGALQRRPTDSLDEGSRNRSIHRNRFFGRNRGPEGDVESGMADIPEDNRLDPRTGTISPQAWRPSIDRVNEQSDEKSLASSLRQESADDHTSPKRQY